jgi:NADP-dependent 3-hydroxy acid dehydrogenase YdfG
VAAESANPGRSTWRRTAGSCGFGSRKDELDRVVASITKKGGKAEAIALDVSNRADVDKAGGQIVAKHGRIDLLVNSAGVNVPKRKLGRIRTEGWTKVVDINLNGVLLLHARGAAGDAQTKGLAASSTVASWAGRPRLEDAGPGLHHHKTRGAGADPFLQHGRMRQRPARLLPSRPAKSQPDPEIAPGAASAAQMATMLQPEDCGRTIAFVANMPPRVCVNEILISPTHNRGFIQTPA